jgi:AraC family transcriptional regulator
MYAGMLSQRQLADVLAYIDSNIGGDLSLAQLAKIAGLSSSHFTVLFRRTTGMSAHQYVMRRRVGHAIAMLLQASAGICEIAQEAGFSDQSHMARCMRRLIGTTPGTFLHAK